MCDVKEDCNNYKKGAGSEGCENFGTGCFKTKVKATESPAPSGQMDNLVSCKNCETLRKEFTDLVAELKATPNGEIEATSRTFIYVTILKKIETILGS